MAAYLGALSGPLGGWSTCRWWQFGCLVLRESKFVTLCLLPTLAHVFQLQKLRHLAPQGDLPATPIPVDLCKLRSEPFDILYLVFD